MNIKPNKYHFEIIQPENQQHNDIKRKHANKLKTLNPSLNSINYQFTLPHRDH